MFFNIQIADVKRQLLGIDVDKTIADNANVFVLHPNINDIDAGILNIIGDINGYMISPTSTYTSPVSGLTTLLAARWPA